MAEQKAAMDTLTIEQGYLKWHGKRARIVFVNEGLLKDGCPEDIAAYPVEGNCLAPQVLSGDILVVAHNPPARDRDIVLVKVDGWHLVSRYRENGEGVWLESAHSKRTLDGCTIMGVVVLIGRLPNRIITVDGVELGTIPIVGIIG